MKTCQNMYNGCDVKFNVRFTAKDYGMTFPVFVLQLKIMG